MSLNNIRNGLILQIKFIDGLSNADLHNLHYDIILPLSILSFNDLDEGIK